MKSPFNMTVSKLYGLSPLKENDKVGKYHYTKYKKKKPKTYTTQEKIDLGLDVGAIINPAFDFLHAGSKAKEGKYGEAALYAGFGLIPGTAKPLVEGTKKVLSKFKNLFTKSKTLNFGGGDIPKSLTGKVTTKWKKDLHVRNKMEDVEKVAEFKLNEMRSIGKNLDNISFDATKLTPKDVKFRGVIGKRSIVEVRLPNGKTQLFYKSTDFSGKGVEDMWQPYAGHMDLPGNEDWFIKDLSEKHAAELLAKGQQPLIPSVMGKSGGGFKEFYDSKSFRDIAGNLDRLAVEGGFQKHITKGQGYASKR